MILVFGKTGQVATELRKQANVTALGRADADLSNPDACARTIRDYAPQAVVNAAAYTAVDRAEEEEELATTINGDAPGAMAMACAALGIPLVHISTDYVFDGSGTRPWQPDDPTAPLGAYGRSKLVGEGAVRASGATHAILRTSWVFSAHGNNFVKAMLRLGAERDRLSIVADQIGGPTPAADIAAACLSIAHQLHAAPTLSGTYHFSGAPDTSWADFARAIFAEANLQAGVEDIPSSAYPTPAARPENSRMDCSTTAMTFAIPRPDWRIGLKDVIEDLA